MTSAQFPMPPPADPHTPGAFEKHPSKHTHSRRPAYRGRNEPAYDADEARRGNWMIVGVLAVILVGGAWLIFSGLL